MGSQRHCVTKINSLPIGQRPTSSLTLRRGQRSMSNKRQAKLHRAEMNEAAHEIAGTYEWCEGIEWEMWDVWFDWETYYDC